MKNTVRSALLSVLILAMLAGVASAQEPRIPEPESPLRAIPERLLESPPILQSREIQKSQPTANGPQVLIPVPEPEIVIEIPIPGPGNCEFELSLCLAQCPPPSYDRAGIWAPPVFDWHRLRCYLDYMVCKGGVIYEDPGPSGP